MGIDQAWNGGFDREIPKAPTPCSHQSNRGNKTCLLTIFTFPIIHFVCPQILHKPLFSNALGTLHIPKSIWKQWFMQNLGGKQSVLWGMWKWSIGPVIKPCIPHGPGIRAHRDLTATSCLFNRVCTNKLKAVDFFARIWYKGGKRTAVSGLTSW